MTTIWGVGDHYLGGGDHYCARTDAQCGVHCGAEGGLERCARAFFICFYVLFVHQIVGTISGHTAAASAINSGHHPAWGGEGTGYKHQVRPPPTHLLFDILRNKGDFAKRNFNQQPC